MNQLTSEKEVNARPAADLQTDFASAVPLDYRSPTSPGHDLLVLFSLSKSFDDRALDAASTGPVAQPT
jgi:hypothetical protein